VDSSAVATLDAALRSVAAIDHLGWERYPAQLDPLPLHQPPQIECLPTGARVEFAAFEVDTTRCNYVLAQHGSLLDAPAGTTFKLGLLHYDLLAEQPAEAHVAILFGDALQWETAIAIPSYGKGIDTSFVANRALSKGEPIRLHLHNHGGNTWLLLSLEALLP
jgi:hypothetical protein